jgi:hypothetical protein
MKRIFLLCFSLIALFASCESPESSEPTPVAKHAKVVVIEGPLFEDGYSIFWYKGRVRNDGEITAKFSKIYFYIRDSGNSLIAQEWTYIDDTDLVPAETSAFDVLFSDDGHSIRDRMDKSKTTYEIKWDERK